MQVKAEIRALLLAGYTKRQTWEVIKEQYPDLVPTTFRRWRSDVMKKMKITENDLKAREPINRGTSLHRWLYLYHMAVQTGDLKTAAKCLEKLEDRQGLNPPKTKTTTKRITNNNLLIGQQDMAHIPTDELKRLTQQPAMLTTQEADDIQDAEYE